MISLIVISSCVLDMFISVAMVLSSAVYPYVPTVVSDTVLLSISVLDAVTLAAADVVVKLSEL